MIFTFILSNIQIPEDLFFKPVSLILTERQDSAKDKFNEVHMKHKEAVQRHLDDNEDYESSEDEDDLQDDEILGSVLKSFSTTGNF